MKRGLEMRVWALLVISLLILMIFFPVISAKQTADQTQILTVNPDDSMVWNSTFNMSDPASLSLTNFNQTIQPFMNETGIEGIFTGTFLPPTVWQVADNTSFDGFYFMQLVSFKPDWIMSGSSSSWWRLPVLNVTDWDSLWMIVHRIGNPGLLRLNDSVPGLPNPASRPLMVYRQQYWAEVRNDTWYEQNVTAWDQNFTFYWLKMDAPIYADEHYLVDFYVQTSTTVPGIRCLYAQTDVSDDQIFESNIHLGSSYTTIEADLDISVIHQFGMGHTVSGWDVSPGANNKTLRFYSRTSEPVTNGDYITFLMPFMQDITNSSNAQVTINNINESWEESYWISDNGPTDFTIRSFLWSEAYSNTVFRINVTFQNQSNQIFIHDKYSDLDPWAHVQYPEHRFDDWYPPPYTNTTPVYFYRYAVWFRPFHSLQVTDGAWVNTVLDPQYFLDGRLVDIEALQMRVTDHSDPLYIIVGKAALDISLFIYSISDFLLMDVLPDLDEETVESYINGALLTLRSKAEPIFVLIGYFVEAVKWVVNAASKLFAAQMYIAGLLVPVVAFFLACLITNGIKRFFVEMSISFEGAIEYGANFFKNSVQLIYRPRGV